jgi:hypothetical protein
MRSGTAARSADAGDQGVALLVREIDKTIGEARARDGELAVQADALHAATRELLRTTEALAERLRVDPRSALANASPYMEAFGHTVIAWMWLRQALAASTSNSAFHRGKLAAARWFFRWELPRVQAWHERLRAFDASWLDMRDEWF